MFKNNKKKAASDTIIFKGVEKDSSTSGAFNYSKRNFSSLDGKSTFNFANEPSDYTYIGMFKYPNRGQTLNTANTTLTNKKL